MSDDLNDANDTSRRCWPPDEKEGAGEIPM